MIKCKISHLCRVGAALPFCLCPWIPSSHFWAGLTADKACKSRATRARCNLCSWTRCSDECLQTKEHIRGLKGRVRAWTWSTCFITFISFSLRYNITYMLSNILGCFSKPRSSPWLHHCSLALFLHYHLPSFSMESLCWLVISLGDGSRSTSFEDGELKGWHCISRPVLAAARAAWGSLIRRVPISGKKMLHQNTSVSMLSCFQTNWWPRCFDNIKTPCFIILRACDALIFI